MTVDWAVDEESLVLPGELIFSTTDKRGVITSVNSVFERVSGYGRLSLVGQPHNLVRHPRMPAGLFFIMWSLLLEGRPAVAHVKNKTASGASYWVLATVTPLESGFLSVRTAPSSTAMLDAVSAVYDAALTIEREAAARGASRREVAAAGAAYIESQMPHLGAENIGDFMRALLPAEITGHLRPQAQADALIPEPGKWQAMLAQSNATERELHRLLDHLDDYVDIAHSLSNATRVTHTLESAVITVMEASRVVSHTSPMLAKAGEASSLRAQALVEAMKRLTLSLNRSREHALDLRMRAAQAKLHVDMVSHFVVDVSRGNKDPDRDTQIGLLTEALGHTLADLDSTLAATRLGLEGVSDAIEVISSGFSDFQRTLATWRHLVVRLNLSHEFAGQLGPIDEQLNEGLRNVSLLRSLQASVMRLLEPMDTAPIHASFSALATHVTR